MSPRKQIVKKYMEGFRHTDHDMILSCLTDDVVWEMPGYFIHRGKEAFDKEIENPNADGHPEITIKSVTEENDLVIAEGAVTAALQGGNRLNAVFCDVFQFRGELICKLTTYLMMGNHQS